MIKRALFGIAVAAAIAFALPASSATLTADQAAAKIADEYGVKVLKTAEGTIRGQRVFLVTVMNPGGNFNEAFQVSTLAVDPDTGQLVSGVAHRDSGLDRSDSPQYEPNRQPADAARPGHATWR